MELKLTLASLASVLELQAEAVKELARFEEQVRGQRGQSARKDDAVRRVDRWGSCRFDEMNEEMWRIAAELSEDVVGEYAEKVVDPGLSWMRWERREGSFYASACVLELPVLRIL